MGLSLDLPGGGSNWTVSGFPRVLMPAYSLLKQEQFQLAQACFRNISNPQGHPKPEYPALYSKEISIFAMTSTTMPFKRVHRIICTI